MVIECGTDIGAVRKNNQDACDCGSFSSDSVWGIVCDGMGGASGGNIASELAVNTIRAHITETYHADMSAGNLRAMLQNAVTFANTAVYEASRKNPELIGMGTTAVVLVAAKGALHIAHVGDSRAYILNKEGLIQLTTDHSFVQNLVDFGQITEEEARVHPKRNIITRVVGVHETVRCDYLSTEFSPGDTVIACSDGLTNYMSNQTIEQHIHDYSGKKLIDALIESAINAGGGDNITALVIHYN